MVTANTKFVMLAIAICAATIASLMVDATASIEQVVIAQNLTENMTSSSGNMTGTDNASGAISALGTPP
jgi:hypothetical protein